MHMHATKLGVTDIVEVLVAAGAGGTENRDASQLINAVSRGKNAVADVLISAVTDMNAVDANGRSALGIATRARYDEVIEALKKAGAVLR